MRETSREIVRQFTPQRVMPAELATATDLILLELLEVRANRVDGIHRTTDVCRDVIAHTRPNAATGDALDERRDIERSVGHGRVRVAIDRLPRHSLTGS